MKHNRQLKRFTVLRCAIVVLVALGLLAGCAPKEPPRVLSRNPRSGELYLLRRIVVAPLEDRSGAAASVTAALTDKLTTYLVKTNMFRVLERGQLERVLEEQALGAEGLTTAVSAARLGRLLGAQAVVLPALTEFGVLEHHLGDWQSEDFALDIRRIIIGMDLRFVDTATGEVFFAHHAEAAVRSMGALIVGDNMALGHQLTDENSQASAAARRVIEELVEAVVVTMEEPPWVGAVVKQGDDKVYLNAGSDIGVVTGMRFAVYATGEELIDPATGISLGPVEERAGSVEVVEVHERFSIARILEGGAFKTGDFIRPLPPADDAPTS